jgi:hypothetical protein
MATAVFVALALLCIAESVWHHTNLRPPAEEEP